MHSGPVHYGTEPEVCAYGVGTYRDRIDPYFSPLKQAGNTEMLVSGEW